MLNRRNYPFLAIAAVCISLNLFALALYRKNLGIQDAGRRVEHTYAVIARTQGIYGRVQDMTTAERGFLLTGNEVFLEPYLRSLQLLTSEFAVLEALLADNPPEVARARELRRSIDRHHTLLEGQIAHYRGRRAGNVTVTTQDIEASKQALDLIHAQTAAILQEEERLLALRDAEAVKRQDDFMSTIVFSCILSIVALVLAGALIVLLDRKRQEIERDLRNSEERFALAIEGMQDGVFDYRIREQSIYLSPRLKEMLGETDHTMPSTLEAFNARMHPDDVARTKQASQAYFLRETPVYKNIFRLRHGNGSWRWIMSRGAGRWDAEGKIVRLVGAHTDITEQREYEENLKRVNHELESFTYIASHDLRSPLVNLKGFAGEMQLGIDEVLPLLDGVEQALDPAAKRILARVLREEIPDALGFIRSSVVKMDRLTNGILELSRIGRRDLNPEPVDVAQIVRHTLGALAHQIQARGVTVNVGDLPPVVSDTLSVEQVLGNVIDNAIKYLDPARPGRIDIDGESLGERVLYRIRDNGRGIKDADMHKIFEIFRRAGNNTGIEGEGMGMSYVRATVRRLGGSIWFESKEGEGTIFHIALRNMDSALQRSAA